MSAAPQNLTVGVGSSTGATVTAATNSQVEVPLIVENAPDGIARIEGVNVSVANTSVATVNTVQPLNNSSSDFEANRVDVNAVGPSFVNYSASALSNTTAPGPGSDILVGTVILNTGAAGTTAINLDVRAGFNESSLSSDSQVRQNSRITFTTNGGSLEVSAVQSDFQISSFTPATRATAGDPVSVSATVTNNGTDAGNKTITYELRNETGAVVDSRTFQRNLSAGESTDLSFNVDSAGLPAGNYTHVLSTPDDTASVNLSLAGGDGFLQGTVRDTSNNPIVNADIIVTAPGFNETFENATDSNGDYTVRVPGLGEGAPYDVEIRQPGFQSFSTRGITVGPGETARIDVTLVPIVTPGAIEVSPTSSSAFVGETVNYTVTVYNSSSMPRETIEGETVQATSSNPDVTFVGSDSASTGPNGTATFTVTSANVGTSELNFTVASDPAINTQASVSFIQNGEGSIQGTVLNARTTGNIAGASAWAVLADRFDANRVNNLGELTTPVALPADNDTIFVRLVDNETGQIIDNDNYRVQTNNASDTGVTKVDELNTTDAAVGEGFALVDVDGDGDVNFSHTRLAPEDYYAEVSFTGNMTSQERLNDDPEDMSEDFLRLGPTFSPSANLTLMATIDRAERSNANLVDSPLYTNTEGEVTGGTSVHGDFLLNKLFTDFQQGQAYTVIVGGPGFSSDFADTVVAEDGESFEYQRHDGFRIVDEAREPAAVDIVQNGTQDAAGAEFTPFDNQSDEFAQIVQRDGRTIDHIDVMSYDGVGEPINATVIVEVVDNDSVAGGDNVNATYAGVVNESDDAIVDRSRDTVRVTTGEDGKATVLLRADASTDNFSTVKRATLANDLSKSDETNVTFVGVTRFGSASISGRVTNSTDVALRNVAVWASEFDYGPDASTRLGDQEQFRFDIDPLSNTADGVDEGTDQFEIRFLEYNSSIDPATGSEVGYELTANATVAVNDLRAYEFEDFVAQGIDIPANTSFKLYDQVGENGGYTLDPVPAVDLADLETDYRLDATKYDDPGAGRQANPGRASVLPGTTDDANIVIPDVIAAPPVDDDGFANFQVDSVDAPDSVTAGENLTVDGTVTNVGDAAGTQNLQLEIEGTNVSTGTGAVDIVFVLDDSASMGSQVDAMKSSIITFTDEVEAGGIDARYAVVTFKDDNEVDLDYTSDVDTLQSTVDALSVSGGGDGPEDSFGAIDTAVGLDSREDAETVVIHVTDAESHYAGDGSGFTDVTRDDVATSLNEPGRSYVAVSPASFPFGDEEGNVTAMALDDVDDGVWFDIDEGDFGDLLIDEIATTVRDRASAGTSLSLVAGETGSYSITVDTTGIAPGTYNVTVSTENDSASTSTTITAAAGPGDVTGDGNPATDVDDDGLYEDVNGDGTFDIFDVQAFLENFEDSASSSAFDFNEDGSVDIFDVQALLDEL